MAADWNRAVIPYMHMTGAQGLLAVMRCTYNPAIPGIGGGGGGGVKGACGP